MSHSDPTHDPENELAQDKADELWDRYKEDQMTCTCSKPLAERFGLTVPAHNPTCNIA